MFSETDTLTRATNDVRSAFGTDFQANWVFIVTWYAVPNYNYEMYYGYEPAYEAIFRVTIISLYKC